MLIVNNKWRWFIPLLLLTDNLQASNLCLGFENSAIVATTPTADFIDNGDGTVTHHKTGLMWQRCSLGQTWDDGNCSGDALYYSWADALQHAKQNTFAGASDWRLPNKNELLSIVEYRCFAPAINSKIFPNTLVPNTLEGMYWSSTPNPNNSSRAWLITFYNGYVNGYLESYVYDSNFIRVRLVRDVQ